MARISVFGAAGRAGRAIVAEAARRGHRVTAVVRDPVAHPDIDAVAGDVTDAGAVARLVADHDAVVHAAADLTAPPDVFFPAAASALLSGLDAAGVSRLVVVGLASVLPTADGTLLMDTPGYPNEYRSFYLGHNAGAEVFRAADGTLDWAILSPAGDFDHIGADVGSYRSASAAADKLITYPDFALAVLDQLEHPTIHRRHQGITAAG